MKDTYDAEYADAFQLYEVAIDAGWRSVRSIPLAGQGPFEALTIRGLIRIVKTRSPVLRIRRADGYGPERVTVKAITSGNYLAAIAWRPLQGA
ncbi:MAG: hypothetical protein AAGL17_08030 [Cyanobacteria bacterium J06576_12]